MKPRERVRMALEHKQPDRAPLDLGATAVTGMAASTVYKLRQALKLDKPGTPVKVVEPYQMLGEIAPDLRQALGVDTVGLGGLKNMFGFENEGWKPWRLFDGTPVLVPAGFNTEPDARGDIPMYPQGDRSVPPSARMPRGGFYFDAIIRQQPIDDSKLDPNDNLEDYPLLTDAELEHFRREAERLYQETDCAIVAGLFGFGFGDIALVPGVSVKHPKGIRDVEEWYASLAMRRGYVFEVFSRQCETVLKNLELLRQAVGDRVDVAGVSGTDFGGQRGPLFSIASYRELFKPFHKRVNDWIHARTRWKTFIHSCGGVEPFIPEFIDAGFDILNPVQTSAAGMDPAALKAKYGDRICFWGGGVDTQRTLPFGTPDEVRAQVKERARVFGAGGGFVFNTVHNVQAAIPVENVLAMYEALGRTPSNTPA